MPIIEVSNSAVGGTYGAQGAITNAGVPASGTYNGTLEKGGLVIDSTNGKLYINTGTKAATVFTVVGTQV